MSNKEIVEVVGKNNISEGIRKWLTFLVSVISVLLFMVGILINFNNRISKIEYCTENNKVMLEKLERKIEDLNNKVNQLYYSDTRRN